MSRPLTLVRTGAGVTGVARHLAPLLLLALAATAAADDAQKRRAEMQKALNDAVMASPFDPGDVQKAQAYAEEAKKQNLPPVQSPPPYWQPGWTCGHLTGYLHYRYDTYRNCIYYHRYYGRYWR